MEGDLIHIKKWLLPLSWLYGVGVTARNMLFDTGVLESKSYDIPIINVGNITVGGTGKTPHVELLIRLLSEDYKVAVLSRGYRRKSSGYVLASTETPMKVIGDESWQIKQKFPHVYVAVDANRRRGIERLMHDEDTRDVQVILLDDAYQHRYVKPGCNILLVDYHRTVTDDCLLPAGHLREDISGINRANIVIVSKCPHNITPMGYRILRSMLNLRPFQQLYFSTLKYKKAHLLFGEGSFSIDTLRGENNHVLLLTGIGNPMQMEQDLRVYAQHVQPLSFPDHHFFKRSDVELINKTFAEMPRPRLIITTEKDAARLRALDGLSVDVREHLYVLPIEIEIMRNEKKKLTENIINYVDQNQRNR
ncbi:MAG: tetraacyldisaccharide 4'-kinase [Bacteroidaceae bacterium]|nr:tetraacyldisaccharide 4'-kinase [Bacteroidaceae bacterium]